MQREEIDERLQRAVAILVDEHGRIKDRLKVAYISQLAEIPVPADLPDELIALQDGRVLTGVLKDQTPTSFTVIDSKDQRTTVAVEDVAEMKVSPVSLMPENLLKKLSPQQVRDLFKFLESDDHRKPGSSR